MIGIILQTVSLIYIVMLAIVYFSKKRIDTLENKLFSMLIIINIFGLIIDLVSTSLALKHIKCWLLITSSKLYLIYLLAWILILTVYIFVISTKNERKNVVFQKIYKLSWIFFLISSIALLVLPLNNYMKGDTVYTYGAAATLMYILSTSCIVTWIICMIRNIKELKSKKYIPMFAYLTIGLGATVIQAIYPNLLLITSMETFVTFLMYFTIENPDMKLINELNVAKDQADKANQAKSDFLSSMSHEIRTPLNAIVGFSQALSEEDLPEEAKDEVKDIIMASNGLLEIVNGILDISKIESGKIEIVNSEYEFKEIFDSLVALSKAKMGDKPLDFIVHYDESIPAVLYGDHTRVKQVILNILTNAIKYTREGYVDFKVSSIVKGDICRLIISVEDSGIGIKQENIPKLFSKFERLDLDKNITIEGTGLGLAITKKLVELMNGKIVVQSIYGKGSKFTIAIDQRIVKKQLDKKEEKVEEVTSKAIDVSGKKVLIVDDNKINLKVASRLLQGYKVITEEVDSGFSCIDKIKAKEVYDLILMDDMMPKMSGVETLQKLKEIDGFNIPVVALTANAITGMKEKYLADGFTDYLAKPIDKSELNNIISKYLNK